MSLSGGDAEKEHLAPSTLLVGSTVEAGRRSGCPQPSRAVSDSGSFYHTQMPFPGAMWRCLPSSSTLGLTCMACWHGRSVGSPWTWPGAVLLRMMLRREWPYQLHPAVAASSPRMVS